MKFRSKPSEIEAIQYGPEWDPLLVNRVAEFIAGRPLMANDPETVEYVQPYGPWDPPEHCTIQIQAGANGAQGWVPVPLGHWIVRSVGDHTDHWPVEPGYFEAKYDPC